MNSDEIVDLWKEQKCGIETSGGFAEEVMNQVRRYEQRKRKSVFNACQLIELISSRPAARAAVVVLGAVAGIVRAAIVVLSFLAV